ncbi:MAG: hypothetical protein WAW42_15225 [Candidatus Competibacteraceae bacterium]
MIAWPIEKAGLNKETGNRCQHAALNLPDPVKGETIALLTARRDADRSALVAVAHREGLSELYIPRQVLTVPEIPLLGSGKPDNAAIRRLAAGFPLE